MTQVPRLVRQQVEVMPGVILGLVPAKQAGMVGDKLTLCVHLEPVGKDPSGDVAMGIATVDAVAIDMDETGAVNPQLPLNITIETGGQGT